MLKLFKMNMVYCVKQGDRKVPDSLPVTGCKRMQTSTSRGDYADNIHTKECKQIYYYDESTVKFKKKTVFLLKGIWLVHRVHVL